MLVYPSQEVIDRFYTTYALGQIFVVAGYASSSVKIDTSWCDVDVDKTYAARRTLAKGHLRHF